VTTIPDNIRKTLVEQLTERQTQVSLTVQSLGTTYPNLLVEWKEKLGEIDATLEWLHDQTEGGLPPEATYAVRTILKYLKGDFVPPIDLRAATNLFEEMMRDEKERRKTR
jgi:hypothetical protein